MIIDSIENASLYEGVSQAIAAGLQFLAGVDPAAITEHREEIEGSSLFAIFQSYPTKAPDDSPFEAHDQHIDIQFVAKGSELIRVAPRDDLEEKTPYDGSKDVAFYHPGDSQDVELRAGQFVILFPHEAHLPQLQADGPSEVKKVVVKVAL